MESALVCVDVVSEGDDVFAVSVCVLQRDLYRVALLLGLVVEDGRVDRILVLVEVGYEFLDAALKVEVILALRADSLVSEVDGETLVEESHLAESSLQCLVVVDCLVEDLAVRPELCLGSGLACLVFAYYLELCGAFASEVLLLIDLVVASYLHDHVCRKRVNDGRADAVQSAGYLVSSTAELAAGVQLSMYYLNCRYAHLRMDVYRHTASVVLNGYGVVGLDADADVFTISCERFVDRVVYYLIYEVVESRRARTSDVHSRSEPYRLKTLEDLYLTCAVFLLLCHYVFTYLSSLCCPCLAGLF